MIKDSLKQGLEKARGSAKDTRITVTVTADQAKQIDRVAEMYGICRSEMIRQLIDDAEIWRL